MTKETQDKPEMKILLPKVDVIFKLLFGDKRNKEILIDFLQSVLKLPDEEYEQITIVDPQLKRESPDDKLGIVDVLLNTKDGKILHIEIQVLEQEDLPERITYYNSKMLVTQLKKGKRYSDLQNTVSIAIADFEIIKNSDEKYHHVFHLREEETGIKFTDLIEINTLELTKIPKTTDNTKKCEWLQFLKAEKEEEFEMLATRNSVIEKAYVELKRLSQDEETRMLYEAREKAIMDEFSRRKSAEEKGRKEGLQEGLQKGKQEGLQEGLEKGLQEGLEKGLQESIQEKTQSAKQMIDDGLDVNIIMKYTNLPMDYIEKIKQGL